MNIIALTEEQYNNLQQQIAEIREALKAERKEDIYDNADVIQLLKVSPRTLATWRENGTIQFSKIGSKIFYRRESIEAMLKEASSKDF